MTGKLRWFSAKNAFFSNKLQGSYECFEHHKEVPMWGRGRGVISLDIGRVPTDMVVVKSDSSHMIKVQFGGLFKWMV